MYGYISEKRYSVTQILLNFMITNKTGRKGEIFLIDSRTREMKGKKILDRPQDRYLSEINCQIS